MAKTRSLALHHLTNELVGRFDVLAIEDLDVAGMVEFTPGRPKRADLARRILDASFSEFRRQIVYKAAEYGHRVVLVNRFYPSSKVCSTS